MMPWLVPAWFDIHKIAASLLSNSLMHIPAKSIGVSIRTVIELGILSGPFKPVLLAYEPNTFTGMHIEKIKNWWLVFLIGRHLLKSPDIQNLTPHFFIQF